MQFFNTYRTLEYAKETEQQPAKQLELACDYFAVLLGKEISEIVPGYISTEVDARLSFDTQATINKAHTLLSLYEWKNIVYFNTIFIGQDFVIFTSTRYQVIRYFCIALWCAANSQG